MVKTFLDWLPAAVGAMAAGVVVWLVTRGHAIGWDSMGLAAFAVAICVAAAWALKMIVGGGEGAPQTPLGPDKTTMANRIAPLIIAIGTAGIVVIAVGVLIAINHKAVVGDEEELRTATLAIFSSVLPVFATWVGTVIAFYFTNESFRQAAESTRALTAPSDGDEPIVAPTRMIPVAKITSITLGTDEVSEDPKTILMSVLGLKFGPTVTRVIIFDKQKRPVYIIRSKLYEQDKPGNVGVYLEKHLADATNFRFLTERATVGDARNLMKMFNTVDVFITTNGNPEEPVRGWVTDDRVL